MKKIKLTQSEIDNATTAKNTIRGDDIRYTIIRRPQADGRYWLASINIDTNKVLWEKFADDKEGVREAVHEVNRWMDKCGMSGKMSWVSRERWNVKGKYKKH